VIASIGGSVLVRRPDHVILDAGGVGYRLAVSTETLRAVPAIGERAFLHAHLVARDDAMSLYGFASEEERDLFLMLISISGVGPKVALSTLSDGPVRELISAIASGDAKRFQAVPGIGKRTAERIILDLRDKVAADVGEALKVAVEPEGPRAEAREGLLGLGYTPVEADQLLASAQGESAEELLRSALRGGAGDRAAA